MVHVQVPGILEKQQQLKAKGLSFVYYNEYKPVGRNLISFNQYAVSFILSGEKELYRGADCLLLGSHDAVLIPSGNAIIAERKLAAEKYSSLVIFFEPQLAEEFLRTRAPAMHNRQGKNTVVKNQSFLKFHRDPYLREYIKTLLYLIEKEVPVPPSLLLHKLEELFLILVEKFSLAFRQMFMSHAAQNANKLRDIVENNILNNLTLNELAFLANRSLAQFKRDFEKEYQLSPGKYLRERKLDIGMHAVCDGQPLHTVADTLGYENVSNFIMAFKRKYGKTPKAYQSGC